MKIIALILVIISPLVYAQEPAKGDSTQHQIPINPNKVDEQGRKTGKWTILYNKYWNKIENTNEATYYRLITYKEGKPVGKIGDYYRSGQIQMEGVLFSELFLDNPETYDGKVFYYSKEGKISNIEFWDSGIEKSKNYVEIARLILAEEEINIEQLAKPLHYSDTIIHNSNSKRTALVIGNANYPNTPLRNPKNDAVAMTATLRLLGFEVLSYTNVSRKEMHKAIQDFGDLLNKKKGIGLFYYAGHGLQYQGRNYLVPIDAEIERAYQIEDECVRAEQVLNMMEMYKNPFNLIILDACRNNPYTSSSRDMNQGLAEMKNAPVGSLIAFATAPGSVASDGDGDNGLYTQELIKAMKIPGLSIEQVFKEVRNNVYTITDKLQVPWENSSLRSDFYFIQPDNVKIDWGDDNKPLYLNCGNEIDIQIPTLVTRNLSFLISNGTLLMNDKGKLIIIPDSSSVELTVINDGQIIGSKHFAAIDIPQPNIEILLNGEAMDLAMGLKPELDDTLDIKVVPEQRFASHFPRDARYMVIYEIILARRDRPIKKNHIFWESLPLSQYVDFPKYGDRFIIRLKAVLRRNYQNDIEEVKGFGNTTFQFSVY